MSRTRFAPSPTGLLHVGNAYSALMCESWAKEHQADFILRVEDLDSTRCTEAKTKQMLDDLAWLGLSFAEEVTYQQHRLPLYQQALQALQTMGVLYPCFCTRKQIADAIRQRKTQVESHLECKQQGKLDIYPETCRTLSQKEVKLQTEKGVPFSWRLDSKRVAEILEREALYWLDENGKKHAFCIEQIGDVIVGRKDIKYSYHLSVVVDDEAQGITHVIRGQDLYSSTPVHRILQMLLGYRRPVYQHHHLLKDEHNQRLAKTKQSISLKSLREACVSQALFRSICEGETDEVMKQINELLASTN